MTIKARDNRRDATVMIRFGAGGGGGIRNSSENTFVLIIIRHRNNSSKEFVSWFLRFKDGFGSKIVNLIRKRQG